MLCRTFACFVAIGTAICAHPGVDGQPQMTWQGEVDGAAVLFVHGKRLKIEQKSGGSVARQRYRFTEPLPDNRQDVRLQVLEGPGEVRIVEQPRADNDFTLALTIQNRQRGPSQYSLALYWTADESTTRLDRLKWSGRVDNEVIVACSASQCSSTAIAGAPVMHESAKFSRPLPQSDVAVNVQTLEGRGEVAIIEQPSERNGFTTRVRIRDGDPGASDYAFALTWRRPEAGGAQVLPAARGLLWSARVAGEVRVTIRGGAAFSQALSGPPVTAERTIFDRPLPARSDLRPVLTKRQGQGAVELLESPSSRNGYELVFIVHGATTPEPYEIEVAW